MDFNGDAFCSPPALTTIACKVNVENFPYDQKHCILKFARLVYTSLCFITTFSMINHKCNVTNLKSLLTIFSQS